MDNKFLETIRHHVSCFLVASITNAWHQELSLKSSSYPVVNTLGLSPAFLQRQDSILLKYWRIWYPTIGDSTIENTTT